MHLNCGYFNAAYRGLASQIIYDGTPAGPRGIPTREILGSSFRVNEPMHNILYHPTRDLNYRFMVAEFLWILFGYDDAPSIGNYNKRIVEFSDDGMKMWGAYGPRLQVALPYVLGKLKEDPQTRQAVAGIWETPWMPTKDVMCTLNVQFIRREDFLNTIVTMRSSDIFLGLPYDFYVFSQIMNLLCFHLGCLPGFLQFNLGSAHMYERDLDRLGEMCSGLQDISCYGSDRMFSPPPPELAAIFNAPSLPINDGQVILNDRGKTVDFPQPWFTFAKVLTHPRKEAFNLLLTDQ